MKKLLALLIAMLTLTGCSGIADKDNIIDLLSSPKLSRRENAIVECITEHLGEDIILKYPKHGSNISPVQVVDLESDGSEEAVTAFAAALAAEYGLKPEHKSKVARARQLAQK